MRDWFRSLIEDWLPWYHPRIEKVRNRHTEAIRRRSIATRKRSERVIAEYQLAALAASKSGEVLVDELRKLHK